MCRRESQRRKSKLWRINSLDWSWKPDSFTSEENVDGISEDHKVLTDRNVQPDWPAEIKLPFTQLS